MNSVIFLIALALFNEDRSGDLTSHWAIANTVLNRIDDERWSDNTAGVLSQKHQFPWYKSKKCTRYWTDLESEAWQNAVQNARTIIVSRPMVHHNFCYFDSKRARPRWSRNMRMYKYGPHRYYECDGVK